MPWVTEQAYDEDEEKEVAVQFPIEGTRVVTTEPVQTRQVGGDEVFITVPTGTTGTVVSYVVEWWDVDVELDWETKPRMWFPPEALKEIA